MIITNLINNIFHAVWLYALASNPRLSRAKKAAVCIGAGTFYEVICLSGFLYDWGKTKWLFTLGYFFGVVLFYFVYAFVLSGGSKQKSAFIYSTYTSMWVFTYFFAKYFSDLLFGGDLWAVWTGRIVINIILLILYERFLKQYFKDMEPELKHSWNIMIVISVLIFLLLTLFLVYIYIYDATGIFTVTFLLCALLLSLATYVMLFVFIEKQSLYIRTEMIKHQNLLLSERIKSFELEENEIRQMRHDIRHHNIVISDYAKEGNCNAIIDYIGRYEAADDEKLKKRLCADRTIDTICSAYISKAEKNHINITADIMLKGKSGIDDVCMVAILANILDNALNGCLKVKGERNISLKISERGKKLIIFCKNTCLKDIVFENSLPQNNERQGIGIRSIVDAAAEYSGVTSFSAKDGVFICTVILNRNGKIML